jgi:hypothetical protein
MKKISKQRIKKLLPKIGRWSLWIGLATFMLFVSIQSYIALHGGASVQEVDGRKYTPVVNELLLVIIVAVVLLFALKLFTNLKLVYLVLIGTILFGLIGWFGLWSFNYTKQDPVEGFITVLLIIGSVSLITAMALLYERHVKLKRKK